MRFRKLRLVFVACKISMEEIVTGSVVLESI